MTKSRLPDLIRFLALHAAIGFALAGFFVFGLIALNPNDIGTLLAHAEGYPVPTLLLWFMLGLTTSSCQMGAAIMLLGASSRNDDAGPGAIETSLRLLPVPLPTRSSR
jgi:hypothetical protein